MPDKSGAVFFLKAAGGAAITWLTGLPVAVKLLIGMIGFDIVTGMIAAAIAGQLSSQVSWRGMARKCLILAIVAMGHMIDDMLPLGVPLGAIAAGFYIVHEATSILENLDRAGVPYPPIMKESFRRMAAEKELQPVARVIARETAREVRESVLDPTRVMCEPEREAAREAERNT